VRALNDVGYSEYGTASAVSGTTPSAVSNLSVTYYGSPFFWNSVNWSSPAGGSPVQGYHVERIVTEGPYVFVTDVTQTTYLDQGVSHTTDYWYRITPYNQVGEGPSSVVHFTTP
jgi:hypothetical protein